MADRVEPTTAKFDFLQHVSGDRRSCNFQINQDGIAKVAINLSASDVEKLIQSLADHRARMLDEPPRSLEAGQQVPAIDDPVIGSASERFNGKRLLAVRHPGMGWLAFFLPETEAARLADWMTRPLS